MIVEWFFSKELKKAIIDLREKNDLNVTAVNNIQRQLLWPIFIAGLMFLGVIIGGYPLVWLIPVLFLCFMLCFMVVGGVTKYRVMPFTFGEKVQACVRDVYKAKSSTATPMEWYIFCDYEDFEGGVVSKRFRVPVKESAFIAPPKQGGVVDIFFHPTNSKISVIGADKRVFEYCLSLSRLKAFTEKENEDG